MKDPAELLVPTTVQYELHKWVKRESDETTALDTLALAENSLIVLLSTEIALMAADFSGGIPGHTPSSHRPGTGRALPRPAESRLAAAGPF